MGNYGIKISAPGYDITNTNIQYQVFNSTANSLKIFKAGSVTFTVLAVGAGGSNTSNVEIYHNLSYQPYFLSWYKLYSTGGVETNKIYFQDSYDDPALFNLYIYGHTRVDTNMLQLSVTATSNGVSTTGDFQVIGYYVIFIDKALI
jgi:hypothetical protein